MAYNDDVIPTSILAFMKKSETRCYPFCSHPSCWQSLEREVRNIPHFMPDIKKHIDVIDHSGGLPTMSVNDLLTQNEDFIGNNEKRWPLVQHSPNYLPMLQRIKLEGRRKESGCSVTSTQIKEAQIYEMDYDEDPKFEYKLRRNAPQFFVWVPNPKRLNKLPHIVGESPPPHIISANIDKVQSPTVKDMTEAVLPKSVETERILSQKKTCKSPRQEQKPFSPHFYKTTKTSRYDGLQDLLCLPREVMENILSSHTPIEFKSKERVKEILRQYGFYQENCDEEIMCPKKLPLHKAKTKTQCPIPLSKPVFRLKSPQEIETPTPLPRHYEHTNTPIAMMNSGAESPSWLTETILNDFHKQNIPLPHICGINEKPQTSNMAAIGLGLPTLPEGVRTARAFSYSKKSHLDFTLGPMLRYELREDPCCDDRNSEANLRTQISPVDSMMPRPPSTVHINDVPNYESDSIMVPLNSPDYPSSKAKSPSKFLQTKQPEGYDEQARLPHKMKTVLLQYEPSALWGLHKIRYCKSTASTTSSVNTWPIMQEENYIVDQRDKSAKSTTRSIEVRMPISALPIPPPPSPEYKLAGEPYQSPDDNMIVIRSSARSHDSLSMPPMMEEGGESDETMSISACPPDNLDDSSLHVTPIMTSVSPVNSNQHWVKNSEAIHDLESAAEVHNNSLKSENAVIETHVNTINKAQNEVNLVANDAVQPHSYSKIYNVASECQDNILNKSCKSNEESSLAMIQPYSNDSTVVLELSHLNEKERKVYPYENIPMGPQDTDENVVDSVIQMSLNDFAGSFVKANENSSQSRNRLIYNKKSDVITKQTDSSEAYDRVVLFAESIINELLNKLFVCDGSTIDDATICNDDLPIQEKLSVYIPGNISDKNTNSNCLLTLETSSLITSDTFINIVNEQIGSVDPTSDLLLTKPTSMSVINELLEESCSVEKLPSINSLDQYDTITNFNVVTRNKNNEAEDISERHLQCISQASNFIVPHNTPRDSVSDAIRETPESETKTPNSQYTMTH